jgi:hypothetical protein
MDPRRSRYEASSEQRSGPRHRKSRPWAAWLATACVLGTALTGLTFGIHRSMADSDSQNSSIAATDSQARAAQGSGQQGAQTRLISSNRPHGAAARPSPKDSKAAGHSSVPAGSATDPAQGGGGGGGGGGGNPGLPLINGAAPLLGTTVCSLGQLAQNTAEFGHLPVVHTYYTGLPPSNAWTTGLAGAAASQSVLIVSFNASTSSILSGSDDAVLSHFFDTAPRSYPIYYSYIHEPEHEVQHDGLNVADYKAAWAHVVELADNADNPELHSILILEAYDLIPASHRDWLSYLPGGGIISTLGWDAYPGRQLAPPAQFMAAAVAASESVHMPFGFTEFGWPEVSGRAAWLSEVGNYLMNTGALFGILFDSPNVQPSFLVSDPASIAVWRSFVQASVNADS